MCSDIIRSKVNLYYRGHPNRFLKAVSLSQSAYYRRLENPANITISELRRFKTVLHLTDDEVLQIVGGK